MSDAFRLSVLDQTPVAEGSDAAAAVRETIDLARRCEALGYHRYWLAEHHGTSSVAGAAPEALIGPVALATSRMRIGSGGIMLPHYSPFKVAETFSLLSAMAPGRIDLGLGRAPGSDGRTAYAMQRDRTRRMPPDDFPQQLAELLAYIAPGGGLPADHPFAPLRATLPGGGGAPEPWLLGSSPDSARWAGEMGLPYCIADFINPDAAMLAEIYRRAFRPSAMLAAPYVMAATWTIAASDHAEAERLAAPARMMFAHFLAGTSIPIPPAEKAIAWIAANPDAAFRHRRRTVVGSPDEVRRGLEEVARDYRADELMLVNIMSDHAARVRSYALVAEAFGLAPAALAA